MQIANWKSAPLEQRKRLSESLIWTLQRNFYTHHGIDAWRSEGIPFHITSNSFIAEAYAKVVLGFLRDCQGAVEPTGERPLFDPSEPFYIVELGSGHGRFSYLFLKKLLKLHQASALRHLRFQYIMTDLVESNLEFWRNHSQLQPFLDDGVLDIGLFDAERDREIRLVRSGRVLAPGAVRNPMILIANYVFDSIPQDAFWIENGQLYESLITLSSRQKKIDAEDPDILSSVEISYHHNPIGPDYYEDPDLNQILRNQQRRLPTTAFLFPTSALRCLHTFRRISNGHLLLLSADKGLNRDESLLFGHGLPGIARHARGCFSMMVDYRIIGEYFLRQGGEALHPSHPHEGISISAFLLGRATAGFDETRQAYQAEIEDFGPDDFFVLSRSLDSHLDSLSLEQALAYLRWSAWDHRVLRSLIPVLKRSSGDPGLADSRKYLLLEGIQRVLECYYFIGEDDDLAFQGGVLLLEMELYREALELFEKSASFYEMEPGTAYNMGLCYYGLREMESAAESISRALELDPDYDAARTMQIRLQSALVRP